MSESGKFYKKIALVNGTNYPTLTLPVRIVPGIVPAEPEGNPFVITDTQDIITCTVPASSDLPDFAAVGLNVIEVCGVDADAIQAGLPSLQGFWEYRTFRCQMLDVGTPVYVGVMKGNCQAPGHALARPRLHASDRKKDFSSGDGPRFRTAMVRHLDPQVPRPDLQLGGRNRVVRDHPRASTITSRWSTYVRNRITIMRCKRCGQSGCDNTRRLKMSKYRICGWLVALSCFSGGPLYAQLTTVLQFSGVRTGPGIATAVHISNIATSTIQYRVAVYNFNGLTSYSTATQSVFVGETRTVVFSFGGGGTTFFAEDVNVDTTASINQGRGLIQIDPPGGQVIASVQVLDATNAIPRFIYDLPLVRVWPAGPPLAAATGAGGGGGVALSWDASSLGPQLYRKDDLTEPGLYSWSLVTNKANVVDGKFIVNLAGSKPAEYFTLFSDAQ